MPVKKARADTRLSGKLRELQEVLAEYPPEYLDCRATQHPMRVGGFLRGVGDIRYRYMICPVCGTWRRDRLTSVGDRLGAVYIHPDGYSLAGLYATKKDLRAEQYRRAESQGIVFDDERALMQALQQQRARRARRAQS